MAKKSREEARSGKEETVEESSRKDRRSSTRSSSGVCAEHELFTVNDVM